MLINNFYTFITNIITVINMLLIFLLTNKLTQKNNK